MAELGPFRIFYDGSCPVCGRQADMLRWLDDGRRRVVLEDISRPDFNAARYGLRQEDLMEEIHGITWDGLVLKGMEVFRKAYERLGLGFLAAPTGWPFIRPFADAAYRFFSRNRHLISGWSDPCQSGSCRPR